MTSRIIRRAAILLLVTAALALGGCALTRIDSPVGTWIADEGAHGTLRIYDDGTFTIDDSSFDLAFAVETADGFNGAGIWDIPGQHGQIRLAFTSASVGSMQLHPSALRADFGSGAIRFEDPDQTVGITFRLRSETTAGPTS